MGPANFAESTDSAELCWDSEDEVIWCVLRVDEHDGDQARDNVDAIARLRDRLGRKKVRVLIDIRNVRLLTRQARAFYANEYTASVERATALVSGDSLARIVANFSLGLNKPMSPIRMFNASDEAIAWLHEFARD